MQVLTMAPFFPQVAFASAGAVPRVQRSSKVEEGFFGSSAEVCVPAECVLVPSSGEEVAAEAFVEMVDTGVVTPTASAATSPAAAEPSTAIVGTPPAADSSVRTGADSSVRTADSSVRTADSSVRTADSSVEAAILFESLLTEVGTHGCT
jgi:AcrR family transcriptional regulator